MYNCIGISSNRNRIFCFLIKTGGGEKKKTVTVHSLRYSDRLWELPPHGLDARYA